MNNSRGGAMRARPSRKRAAPTPPARATIMSKPRQQAGNAHAGMLGLAPDVERDQQRRRCLRPNGRFRAGRHRRRALRAAWRPIQRPLALASALVAADEHIAIDGMFEFGQQRQRRVSEMRLRRRRPQARSARPAARPIPQTASGAAWPIRRWPLRAAPWHPPGWRPGENWRARISRWGSAPLAAPSGWRFRPQLPRRHSRRPSTSAAGSASRIRPAAACAFATSRDPMRTGAPARAKRSARPKPSAPVPPMMAIVRGMYPPF